MRVSILISRSVITGVILLYGCSAIRAEQPDSISYHLESVSVVADRVKEDVKSSAPLFCLTDEKMKLMGVTDLTDALHRLPGLDIRDYGGAGGMKTVSVRGFGTTHTGVIYDGVALSDCQSGKIDLSRYSLDNVDDLSLVIGDNNDIFTPAKAVAAAASITINTGSVPEPEDSTLHLTTQLRVGSFGMINPYIKVGKSLSERFSLSAIGEYTHADNDYPFTLHNGILVSRERRSNSRMNSGHAELNGRWRITPSSRLDSKVYFYDNSRQLPGPVVLYNPKSDDTLHDRNFFGQISFTDFSLSRLMFRLIGKFNWDATYYHEVDGKYTAGFNDENYIQREAYLSAGMLYTPRQELSLSYAADYTYNNLSSNDVATVGPRRNSILQSLAAKYHNSRIIVTGRLLFSIYDNEVKKGASAADRKKLSPSLSLSVRPFTDHSLFVRTSYKNIFRMPTFNESYYYRMGSTSLRPEDTQQFNVGLTWQSNLTPAWIRGVSLSVDGYYNHVKDKIVAIPQNMFIWTMTNLDKVRAFGADVKADASFALARCQTLTIAGNYSLQRVQPRTAKTDPDYNKQVAYTPIHSGSASLSWQNPWVDIVIKATGAGERYGTNSNLPITRIKGYVETGASLMRSLGIRHHTLDLRFDILNIFDTQYEIVASYPMPGRSFRFSATFRL